MNKRKKKFKHDRHPVMMNICSSNLKKIGQILEDNLETNFLLSYSLLRNTSEGIFSGSCELAG